ncbi:hypothetical protein ACS0TY_027635 [Phlomoides rotata]
MKMTWKKNVSDGKSKKRPIAFNPNLPFEDVNTSSDANSAAEPLMEDELLGKDGGSIKNTDDEAEKSRNIAREFEAQGNKLAEEGKYREALGKWEAAITLMPEKAVLHEQKAQVLLELEEPWNALKAATRATELEPSWAEVKFLLYGTAFACIML